MAYQQADAGRQRACVVAGVLIAQGALAWAVLSGLSVRYVPEITTVFEGRNEPVVQPPPPPPPKPTVTPEPAHRVATAVRPTVAPPRPVAPWPVVTLPIGPASFDPPSPAPSAMPLPQPSPEPSFASLGARAIGDPSRWLSERDYPASELRAGHEGAARFRLAIGADGRVTGCTILVSTGFPALDTATCVTVSRRARFVPARDGRGAVAVGSYVGGVRWTIPRD